MARIAALEEIRYQAGVGEQVRAELVLWERGIDRAQKFCLGYSPRTTTRVETFDPDPQPSQ
jgi:hypothetical protein